MQVLTLSMTEYILPGDVRQSLVEFSWDIMSFLTSLFGNHMNRQYKMIDDIEPDDGVLRLNGTQYAIEEELRIFGPSMTSVT